MGSFFSKKYFWLAETEERRAEAANDSEFSGSDVEEVIANQQAALEQAELDYIPPTPLNGGYYWHNVHEIMDGVHEETEPYVESSTPAAAENPPLIVELSSDSVEITIDELEIPDRTVSDIILERTVSSLMLERTLSSDDDNENLIIASEPIAMV